MGVTLVPALSVPPEKLEAHAAGKPLPKPRKPLRSDQDHTDASFIRYVPFKGDVPSRRVVLAWRRSFTRYEAIAALRNEVYACRLVGVQRLT